MSQFLCTGEDGHYMDPISRKNFTNSSHLVVLRKCGTVMLEETFQKIVKPEGHYNGKAPTNSYINLPL